MAPIACCILAPVVYIAEPTALQSTLKIMDESTIFMVLLTVNTIMAFFVNLTNFLITKHTSALTLQVRYGSSIASSRSSDAASFTLVKRMNRTNDVSCAQTTRFWVMRKES